MKKQTKKINDNNQTTIKENNYDYVRNLSLILNKNNDNVNYHNVPSNMTLDNKKNLLINYYEKFTDMANNDLHQLNESNCQFHDNDEKK